MRGLLGGCCGPGRPALRNRGFGGRALPFPTGSCFPCCFSGLHWLLLLLLSCRIILLARAIPGMLEQVSEHPPQAQAAYELAIVAALDDGQALQPVFPKRGRWH